MVCTPIGELSVRAHLEGLAAFISAPVFEFASFLAPPGSLPALLSALVTGGEGEEGV